MNPARRGLAVALGLTTAGLSLAACGSDDNTIDSANTIVVGAAFPIDSSILAYPEAKLGLEAAVKAVNKAGGVGGKDVELSLCDTKFDVNAETACARGFVKDKVSAVIDPLFFASTNGQPTEIITKAGIPIIGAIGLAPAELTNPLVYLLGSGLPGWQYGAVAAAVNAGATKISILASVGPSSEYSAAIAADALKLGGIEPVNTVVADSTADPTLATAAAKAVAGGTDAVVFAMLPQDMPKAIVAIRQSGYDGILSASTAALPEPVIKALGPAADGILLTSDGTAFLTDAENPGIKEFESEMATYSPDGELNDVSMQMWASLKLFAAVTDKAATTDASGVADALNSLKDPVDLQLLAPYSIEGVESPLEQYPRLLNPTVVYGTVKDGAPVAESGFENPFTSLQQSN